MPGECERPGTPWDKLEDDRNIISPYRVGSDQSTQLSSLQSREDPPLLCQEDTVGEEAHLEQWWEEP